MGLSCWRTVDAGLGVAGNRINGESAGEAIAGGIVDAAGIGVGAIGKAIDVSENVATGVDVGYQLVDTAYDVGTNNLI